jgi:hypothetical protein
LRNEKFQRDFGFSTPMPDNMNRISMTPFFDAAFHHMKRWVDGGAPPPSQPLLEFTQGERPELVRDAHGIAKGGARLPQVDAPVATNSAVPITPEFPASLRGSSHAFGAAKLDALYGDEATYLARFGEAARRAVKAGVMLERDVQPALEEAAQEYRRARASAA